MQSWQKTEECAAGGGVHDLVDPREGIGVLGAGLVEVGEVDAKTLSAVGFWDHDRVGNPLGVGHFADELGHLEFLDLLDDVVFLLWCLTAYLLLHGVRTGAHC